MPAKDEKKRVASIQEYRSMVGREKVVTMPSGAIFKVKRLSPLDYIRGGLTDIPNEFFRYISELAIGIAKTDTEEAKKNAQVFELFLKITIEQGIIDPPTIMKYDKAKEDTHLVFGELTQEDQKYLTDIITGRIEGNE